MCHDVAKQRSQVYRLLPGSCYEAQFPVGLIRTVSLDPHSAADTRTVAQQNHVSQQLYSPMACEQSLLAGQYNAQPQTTMHDCIPRTNLSSLAALTSVMHDVIVMISWSC